MKLAFLFSGQGAQYPGMIKDLYEKSKEVQAVYDKADESLHRSIRDLSFYGNQEELNLTHNTQPCVLAADIAVGTILQACGVKAAAVAGFSLGEYAAMYFAGIIHLEDVFPLIQIRADAMQEAAPVGKGAMAALMGVTPEKARALCEQIQGEYVEPANFNSLTQTVVSGTTSGVDKLIAAAEAEGIRAIKLAVSAPFHCKLMKPAVKKLEEGLKKLTFKEAKLPVYLNYNGERLATKDAAQEMLSRQLYSPVQWVRTLMNMQKDGIDTFIECGPGKTLSGLVKKTLKGVTVLRVENEKTLNDTLNRLGIF